MEYIDPFESEIEEYVKKFDEYFEDKNVKAIEELINEVEQKKENFNELSKARISYSLGTAYADIMYINGELNEENTRKCIYYYSYAINILSNLEIKEENKPYIYPLIMNLYVNYGNALKNIGRINSSIEYYKKALKINPQNKMALGNLCISYMEYADLLYDNGHKDFFYKAAYDGLKKLFDLPFSDEDSINIAAILEFEKYLKLFNDENIQYLKRQYNLYSPKYKNKELKYRKWASKNKLFLNPLNDLYSDERVAYDIIHLPNMQIKTEDVNIYHGMYNQIKEEYIYLRYLFYEATQGKKIEHYADRENLLLKIDNSTLYSIRLEKLKTVFRQLYSMLDKVAYFINSYYDLEIAEKKVSFRNIWNESLTNKDKLNLENNFMLRTIYWTSKEIYSNDDFSTNPCAQEIDLIRNALEHKYVKIYHGTNTAKIENSLAKYVSENKLESMTMYLIKLIREIIISLSLMVNIEESKRNDDENLMNIKLDIYKDELKV